MGKAERCRAHINQIQKFKEAAHELGCDESDDRFREALWTVGRAKPPPDPADDSKPTKKPGQ